MWIVVSDLEFKILNSKISTEKSRQELVHCFLSEEFVEVGLLGISVQTSSNHV